MKVSNHADFEFELIDNVIVIYDLDKGSRSITNDIEFVLKSIKQSIPDIASKKVIYRDSMGTFDGISINAEGGFNCFYSINEKTLEKTLVKINLAKAIN